MSGFNTASVSQYIGDSSPRHAPDFASLPPIENKSHQAFREAVKANSLGQSSVTIARTYDALKSLSLFEHVSVAAPLRQQLALALARVGALDEAGEVLRDLLVTGTPDGETFGLLGSVCKRLCESARNPELARSHLLNACDFYSAGFSAHRDPYCAINAAACRAWLGDREAATALAAEVLGLPPTGDDYWDTATRAEAMLLQGMTQNAMAVYMEAVSLAGGRWADLGTTRKQCRKLCQTLHGNAALFDEVFGVWSVAMVAGFVEGAVDRKNVAASTVDWLRECGAICVWVSVDTDPIVGAEAIRTGIETCVLLPSPRKKFMQQLDAQASEALREDWRYLLERAGTVAELVNATGSASYQPCTVLEQMTKNAVSLASALSCDLHGLVCGPDGSTVSETWQRSGVVVDLLQAGGPLKRTAPGAAGKKPVGNREATEAQSLRGAGIFRALVEELLSRRYI
jgi:tetratricopeptide (TPR) repeat protein